MFMKRFLVGLMLAVVLLFAVGCNIKTVEQETQTETKQESTSMFVEIENAVQWTVVYHKETRVMYAVSNDGYNSGNFTLLVDADGKPMVWEHKNENN